MDDVYTTIGTGFAAGVLGHVFATYVSPLCSRSLLQFGLKVYSEDSHGARTRIRVTNHSLWSIDGLKAFISFNDVQPDDCVKRLYTRRVGGSVVCPRPFVTRETYTPIKNSQLCWAPERNVAEYNLCAGESIYLSPFELLPDDTIIMPSELGYDHPLAYLAAKEYHGILTFIASNMMNKECFFSVKASNPRRPIEIFRTLEIAYPNS